MRPLAATTAWAVWAMLGGCVSVDVDAREYACAADEACGAGYCCDHRADGATSVCRAEASGACQAEAACAAAVEGALCLAGSGLCAARDDRLACLEAPAGMQAVPSTRALLGGAFQIGCSSDCDAGNEPAPVAVALDAFFMDRMEVQAAAIGQGAPDGHPARSVTWADASDHCQAREPAARLCREAEWEYAARGGEASWRHPWDPVAHPDPTCTLANFAGGPGCPGAPWAVGSGDDQREHPFGLADMAGNVREWVADCFEPSYDPQVMADGGPRQDCPSGSQIRVSRGGGYSDPADVVRSTYRIGLSASSAPDDVGFRCCASP